MNRDLQFFGFEKVLQPTDRLLCVDLTLDICIDGHKR